MDRNPYAAPVTDVRDAPDTADQLEMAEKGRRLLNLIIDSFCDYFGMAVFFGLVAVISPSSFEAIDNNSGLATLVSLGWMFGYYVGFETLFGRTIGKFLTGTRVVTTTGGRPALRQIVIRTVSRMVPFEPFSCLSDPPVGWHDRWSGTRVVRTKTGNSRGPAFSLQNSVDVKSPSETLGLR